MLDLNDLHNEVINIRAELDALKDENQRLKVVLSQFVIETEDELNGVLDGCVTDLCFTRKLLDDLLGIDEVLTFEQPAEGD